MTEAMSYIIQYADHRHTAAAADLRLLLYHSENRYNNPTHVHTYCTHARRQKQML
jgi:hypothetical protein